MPALDEHVWLRGRAVNTSDWTILPGRASVYFGADYIGAATLPAVKPGEDIELRLGPDPGLELERMQMENLLKGPGVFGSRATRQESWRVRIRTTARPRPDPDGRATVIVQEALPRSTDDRVKVELVRTVPRPRPTSAGRKIATKRA